MEGSRETTARCRQHVLDLLSGGLSQAEIARELGVSRQRVNAILKRIPPDEVEAAREGKARCPHCGKWVEPREAGHPRR